MCDEMHIEMCKEEWQEVRRRGRRSNDLRANEGISTFFFRNFPEHCSASRLRRKFEEVGKVVEVFIPAKRDKQGHKFGFVRFAVRGGSRHLLDKLNKVWVDSFVIRAFVPRFAKPQGLVGKEEAREERWGREDMAVEAAAKASGSRGGGSSFANLLKGGKETETSDTRAQEHKREERKGGGFLSSEEEGRWLVGVFTGKLKDDFLWKFHGDEIRNECFGMLSVTDMGERMVLIRSATKDNTEAVIGGLGEWTSYWFEWCRPWKIRDVNQRRLVWTRWIGVPLHAWSRRFFSWGCDRMGRLVELLDATESKRKLDVAYVRVLTGLNSLDGILACRIDGDFFNIKIEEVKCNDQVKKLQHGYNSESELESSWSEGRDCSDLDSVHARWSTAPAVELAAGMVATGANDASFSSKHAGNAVLFGSSIPKKTAGIKQVDLGMGETRDPEVGVRPMGLSFPIGPRHGPVLGGSGFEGGGDTKELGLDGNGRHPTRGSPILVEVRNEELGPTSLGGKSPIAVNCNCPHQLRSLSSSNDTSAMPNSLSLNASNCGVSVINQERMGNDESGERGRLAEKEKTRRVRGRSTGAIRERSVSNRCDSRGEMEGGDERSRAEVHRAILTAEVGRNWVNGKESWNLGKKLGLKARGSEEYVVQALDSLEGGGDGLGARSAAFQ